MKIWLYAIMFSVLLLVPSSSQLADASQPPPKIVFKGIKDACKVFEITDIDGGLTGSIKKVIVEGTNIVPSVKPVVGASQVDNTFTFDYEAAGRGLPPMVTLTVCGKPGEDLSQFTIKAIDKDNLVSNLVAAVNKLAVLNAADEVNGEVAFLINLALGKDELCKAAEKKGIPTEIIGLQLTDGTTVILEKSPNVKKPKIQDCTPGAIASALIGGSMILPGPGILILAGDPEGDFFLSVLELCIDDGNSVQCPQNFETSILLASIPIGGNLLPIETVSLLLAGAQTFSWMIPVLISGIGIGLFVVSRKKNNS